jgi:2,4-dichlorophenol 6-monooxygenase
MEREERRSLGTVKSVERAGGILRLFLGERRGVAVTEVAESLAVSNSTAHRLLRSLCETGLLEQNESTRRYELSLKNYEFNAHGVELNQRYRSAAVVGDQTEEPGYDRDPELHYHPTTWPGARLPHCWLVRDGRRISTHDLAGRGRFTLLTGIGGEPWLEAAREVAGATGVEIAAVAIGPGRDVRDVYGDWAGLSEIAEAGCVLVRPDLHVGWRSHDLLDDAAAELDRVVRSILAGPAASTDHEVSAP